MVMYTTPTKFPFDCFRLIQLSILVILLPLALNAQEDNLNIRFDNISIKDGLSQSSPNCIFQDSRGILWIGTEDGLNKYDGYSFLVYKPEQNDQFSISNPRILSICEDADAFLWIGTNGGGLNKYDRKTNRFYHFLPEKQDSLSISGSLVYALIPLSEKELWVGTDQGLSILDLKTNRFVKPGTNPALKPLSENAILSFARDNALLWIGTENGLYCYDLNKNTLTNYQSNPEDNETLTDNRVTAILADKNHNLWAGTETGLAMMKAGSSSFARISNLSSPGLHTSSYRIKALLEDDKGNIWIGTFGGGLTIIAGRSGKFFHFIYDYNNPNSLSNNEVLSLYMDFSGIIWVGTNGLDKYNPKKEKFVLFDYVPYTREKLVFRNIHPIYEDAEGILWVGSKSDGLHILNRKNKAYSRMVHEPGNPNSLSSSRIRSVKEYPEGTLWIGTEDQGLNKVKLNGNRQPVRYTSFKNTPGNQKSLTSNKIYAIYPDFENRLWIGTDNGLTIMDISSETFTQYLPDPENPSSLSNLTVYCIYGDRAGNIWLATDFGINRFDPSTGGFIHYTHNEKDTTTIIHNEILCFHEDNQGNLWIGTYGKGLDKFNIKNQTFEHFASIRQLSTAVIYGILQDDQETLWLSTNNGIIKFNPARGEINQFSIEDGLQSNEFNGTSYFKSLTGEMFFGGQYGFNSFFPNTVVKDSVSPKIILSDLQVGNSSVTPGEKSPIGQHINEVKEIILNHRQNNFTLYFSALHFANPLKNRYKYRLVGFDKDWIDAGNRRFVSYTSLPYKSYTFRVIASNSDGIWNETGLEVKIKVSPPFWATIWFRIFMILVILTGTYFLLKKRLISERRQKQVFEEKYQASSKELQEALEQLEVQHEEIVVQKRELKLRQRDQENLLWFNHGLGLFSDIISKNRDDVTQLCNIFIQKLVEYVEVEQGGVFLINDDQPDNPFLELAGSYAFNVERTSQQFLPGEGYIGTCFTSCELMEIDNLTDKYSEVRSGLGSDYVKHLLLAPMKINDQCIGVVELGSFKKIRGYRVSFVEKLMETFASIINTERANTKLKKLIEHSTFQANELAESEEQLRLNLEEIMATQEESSRREDELIKLAEEAASREEMLNHEIEELKNRIEALTRQRQNP